MAVIGSKRIAKGDEKYFYKITRNAQQEIILTKIEVHNSQGSNIVLNDPKLVSAETQHVFRGFNTDYTYVNVADRSQNKSIIDNPLGVSQYKVRNEDITYFINEDGDLIARLNT